MSKIRKRFFRKAKFLERPESSHGAKINRRTKLSVKTDEVQKQFRSRSRTCRRCNDCVNTLINHATAVCRTSKCQCVMCQFNDKHQRIWTDGERGLRIMINEETHTLHYDRSAMLLRERERERERARHLVGSFSHAYCADRADEKALHMFTIQNTKNSRSMRVLDTNMDPCYAKQNASSNATLCYASASANTRFKNII